MIKSRKDRGFVVLLALIAVVPTNDAYAYVDPNAAGPLFQFLFPALIAAVSFAAACKRAIRRGWNRVVDLVTSPFQRKRVPPESEKPADLEW